MAKHKSPRQRQSRLAFTPLPSSSPAAKGYPKQIQERAAAVTIDSPSKRRKLRHDGDASFGLDGAEDVMPTPVATLEKTVEEDDDSEPVRGTQRRIDGHGSKKRRTRQQRLDFSSGRDRDSFRSPIKLPSSSQARSGSKGNMRGSMFDSSQRMRVIVDDESEDEYERELPAIELVGVKRVSKIKDAHDRTTRSRQPVTVDSAGEGESDNIVVSSAHKARASFNCAADEDAEDMTASHPTSSVRRSVLGSQRKRTNVIDESEEESDQELPTAAKVIADARRPQTRGSGTRSTRKSQPITANSDSEDNNTFSSGQKAPIPVDSDDGEEEDDMPTTAGKQRRQRQRQRQSSPDDFIVNSPPEMADSESEGEIIEQRKKRKRRHAASDDEEEIETVTPSRRKLKSRKLNNLERAELKEDLEGLRDSSDAESEVQTPINTQKSARLNALEHLKRKRSTARQSSVISSDPPADEASSQASNGGSQDEDEEDQYPMSSAMLFRENEDDVDFIEEDTGDNDPFNLPEGMPIEFTRYATMKAKELFKFAVDWMVQKKVNPAFPMNDQIYGLTFKKLNDETQGLVGSKFKSSAWTSEFARALTARPEIAYEPIDRSSAEHYLRDKCDACNRSGHPATFQIQFQRRPYHPETLEPVDAEDEDDDAAGSESSSQLSANQPAYDAAGREVPPEARIFYVGKFCMKNASTAHALQHWRYHLNEYVVTWLERQGYNTPQRIVERDKMSRKKRKKHANKIVDHMEEEGVVASLWKDFRNNLNEARDAKQAGSRFE